MECYDRLEYHSKMPRFSLYSDPKKVAQFINRFWDAVTLIEDRSEAVNFFKELLTPTEVRMLAKRLQIADMLSKGYKYEDIRNFVRVTAQTIASVNNKLNFGDEGLIKILLKLERIDKGRQDRLEGRRNILGQPPGLGKAAGNIVTSELGKFVRRKQKEFSVKASK